MNKNDERKSSAEEKVWSLADTFNEKYGTVYDVGVPATSVPEESHERRASRKDENPKKDASAGTSVLVRMKLSEQVLSDLTALRNYLAIRDGIEYSYDRLLALMLESSPEMMRCRSLRESL